MKNEKNQTNTFLARLKEASGCANISELSKFFGVAHSTIAAWRAARKLPAEKEWPLALRGYNPQWVRSGRGRKRLAAPAQTDAVTGESLCPLRPEIKKMLKICESCASCAALSHAGQTPRPGQAALTATAGRSAYAGQAALPADLDHPEGRRQ